MGVSKFNCLRARVLSAHLLQRTQLVRRSRDTRNTVPQEIQPPPTCASVIPSGIRSGVHVLDAKDIHGCRAVAFWLLLNFRLLKICR